VISPARIAAAVALLSAACRPGGVPAPRCPESVDDGVACTVDACDPATGIVMHLPDHGACPEGQGCSAVGGCSAAAFTCDALRRAAGTAFTFRIVAEGLVGPVHVAAPEGDAARLFVVEQRGLVRVVRAGQVLEPPFLDVTAKVAAGGERGLFSIVFHPQFETNGKVYVAYTDRDGDVRVSEFVAPDPRGDVADPGSERNLLTIEHSTFENHNGGSLAFGPDGLLYAGVGDGGGGGDPSGNAQDTSSLLGKLLRIDVASPAAPAPGNPFGNAVYHYGLRNPWRFSFDRRTGDLYLGDAGQDRWEEIDFQEAAAPGQPPAPGTNWGWNRMEGNHCFAPATGCTTAGLRLPVVEYPHPQGVAAIGGLVYRGVVMPDLAETGTYFYGDLTGFVRTFRMVEGAATAQADVTAALGGPLPGLTSFGEDGCGELHVVAFDGKVRRLVPAR
jgi:glucose/arabinose dehydrogenase